MCWADAIWAGIYKYGIGAGSPVGEILDPQLRPHIASAGASAPIDQIWNPHPHLSDLKSVGSRIRECNCHL